AAIHKITETFGFRTVEFKEKDGIYVNGEKILFKGINHHCFHPESGRTTSKQLSVEDVLLIKEMNMNAVRMSHYPPDKHFLDACDSLGLFVLNELAGWHQSYDTATGKKLVKEMVVRDVNHPSIVLWSNGNEGGWNRELDVEFEKYDPQGRKVIHPFEIFDGTNTGHYKSYNYLCQSLVESNGVFFPTELLHGLYDGGHAAGLKDYWDIMLKEPLSAGCFLWAFLDEAVRRNDKDNQLDTDGNHGADGIVGPYREKEGSFYAVREIWSPIHIHKKFITPAFDGSLLLENRYHFTNLKQCQMEWKLARTPEIDGNHSKVGENKSGRIDIPDIAPGMKGWLKINLPDDWNSYDVLYVTAKDPYGREIFTWSWPLKTNQQLVEQIVDLQEDGAFGVKESDKQLVVKTGKHQFVFDMETGYIEKVIANNKEIPFSNGPAPSHDSLALESLVHGKENGEYVIRCKYVSGFENITWSINPSGWLNLKYSYRPETDQYENLGVNFDFTEDKISSLKFLADGPYRVWKNRMEGNLYGVWDKSYNNTITGKTWDYPEFKGHYSNFSWAKIITNDVPFYIVSATDGLFLRMLTPEFPDDAMFAKANFPGGSISVLNAIPPIGSKVHRPEQLGPRSDYYEFQNWIKSNPPLGGDIYLFFGKLDK
ncbi:MAG: glycoside hydrolase family 2 TIM barrel-domain containing protein, partial [Bacteroidota bacterium]